MLTFIFSAVFCVTFLNSVWKKAREGGADCILLQRRIYIACGKYTKLYRHDDFLFAGQTDCDDEIAGNLAAAADVKISAAVVGCKSCFTGGIAELRKARQKCGVNSRRHTDFEEIGQHHGLVSSCDAHFCADCEAYLISAAVAQQQIQLNDYISVDGYTLGAENRCSHTFFVTVRRVCIHNPFGICTVSANDIQIIALAVL